MKTAVVYVTIWIAICTLYCTGDPIAESTTTEGATTKGEREEHREKRQQGPSEGGLTYTRWGRTTCPSTKGIQLVYEGMVAGGWYAHSGGGANYLCLTKTPQYLSSTIPSGLSYLSGAEYESPVFGDFQGLQDDNVPCAVCYTSQRSAKITIPGTTSCPNSWTEEYSGYLMAERSNHARNAVYECVDGNGEAVPGEGQNTDGALFYHVGVQCDNGLSCPPYILERPITCVVCTK